MINFTYELVTETAKVPTKAHDSDYCYDVFASLTAGRKLEFIVGDKPDNAGTMHVVPFRDKDDQLYIDIAPNHHVQIPLGFKAQLSPCTVYVPYKVTLDDTELSYMPVTLGAKMYVRSSTAIIKGLQLQNSVGVIDSTYPNEWIMWARNTSTRVIRLYDGHKVAQVEFGFSLNPNFVQGEVTVKDRTGGFGSTGTV
jgi:dUTPase